MSLCLFVSDLHGSTRRFDTLFSLIRSTAPVLVFLGGDLLPFGGLLPPRPNKGTTPFIEGYLARRFRSLRSAMGERYPLVLVILGNDDPRREETALREGERSGLWRYLHNSKIDFDAYTLYGYSCIPPTPFLLKDWERYDVSRYVDVGATDPTDGWRSVPVSREQIIGTTIQQELQQLVGEDDLHLAVFLFHAPPYGSNLDLADLDGQMVDSAPLDVHVGSIAVRRFIEQRRPFLTLHGHVHESARLSGDWRQRIGRTWCLSAAHDGPELAAVRFPLEDPAAAERLLL
ncbi:MAG: metallophosphoesterase [Spirochaetales bacterium]|nr:metallophosphoesterase [Spirochaetales bacterium]